MVALGPVLLDRPFLLSCCLAQHSRMKKLPRGRIEAAEAMSRGPRSTSKLGRPQGQSARRDLPGTRAPRAQPSDRHQLALPGQCSRLEQRCRSKPNPMKRPDRQTAHASLHQMNPPVYLRPSSLSEQPIRRQRPNTSSLRHPAALHFRLLRRRTDQHRSADVSGNDQLMSHGPEVALPGFRHGGKSRGGDALTVAAGHLRSWT